MTASRALARSVWCATACIVVLAASSALCIAADSSSTSSAHIERQLGALGEGGNDVTSVYPPPRLNFTYSPAWYVALTLNW